MVRKLHQVVKQAVDYDVDCRRKMDRLKKDLGLTSDTELVRYCITQTFKSHYDYY